MRLQFGLRFVLAVPACIAAFYLGWSTHQSRLQLQQELDHAVTQNRLTAVTREMALQREVRAAILNNSIDGLEHRQRMKSFQRQLREPGAANMFPNGAD